MSLENKNILGKITDQLGGDRAGAEREIERIVYNAIPLWARAVRFAFPLANNTNVYIKQIKESYQLLDIFNEYTHRVSEDNCFEWYTRPRYRWVSKELRKLGIN